jgi:hypothetical protein
MLAQIFRKKTSCNKEIPFRFSDEIHFFQLPGMDIPQVLIFLQFRKSRSIQERLPSLPLGSGDLWNPKFGNQ